ncbi:hypothetical protein [Pseudomonas sp. VE 196-7]|uniref:hypothetical protein n=1 Tax=Pseudomonas sp. VE 196-7 TaxID=2956726 RepID=UPI0021D50D1C|nr:hypothetical protein [Pseudomonas sp. VE 196-7]MCU7217614.1 hypothetical protein [Pseudomonas sp. VE 196-7]
MAEALSQILIWLHARMMVGCILTVNTPIDDTPSDTLISSLLTRRAPDREPMNEKLFVLTNQKKTTNHILHVIMTVLTGGLWLLVWGIIMRSNDAHNKRIDKQINQIMLYKTQGLSDSDTYKQIRKDELDYDVLQGRVIFVIMVVVFLYFYFR